MEPKKLRRSYKDSIIGGVAGGLGEYFATDPLIFRFLFIVLLFAGGGGFPIYILMWIFIPKEKRLFGENFTSSINEENTSQGSEENTSTKMEKSRSTSGQVIGGSILIVVGLFFLLDKLWPGIDFSDLWPAALVIAGLAIVKMNYKGNKSKNETDDAEQSAESSK